MSFLFLQHWDVALITMKEPVPATYEHIRPVCLPSGHQTYANEMGTVVGWGSLRVRNKKLQPLSNISMHFFYLEKLFKNVFVHVFFYRKKDLNRTCCRS
jgi:hypothetical protein